MIFKEKLEELKKILNQMEKVVVAYSGGVDSSLVLAVALKVLGKENVISVVADSDLLLDSDTEGAISLSEEIGAETQLIYLNELEVPEIKYNKPSSWYHSKKLLYRKLCEIKKENGFNYVIDGMIMDDNQDYRPGLRARSDYGVRSVLQEADFYKTDVRASSKYYELVTWNKPASCSVLSRFEYNEHLTIERVNRVIAAENYLKSLGFKIVRVRDHNTVARIEIEKKDFKIFFEYLDKIEEKLLSLGYIFITLDIRGYSYGRMNDTLKI